MPKRRMRGTSRPNRRGMHEPDGARSGADGGEGKPARRVRWGLVEPGAGSEPKGHQIDADKQQAVLRAGALLCR